MLLQKNYSRLRLLAQDRLRAFACGSGNDRVLTAVIALVKTGAGFPRRVDRGRMAEMANAIAVSFEAVNAVGLSVAVGRGFVA